MDSIRQPPALNIFSHSKQNNQIIKINLIYQFFLNFIYNIELLGLINNLKYRTLNKIRGMASPKLFLKCFRHHL